MTASEKPRQPLWRVIVMGVVVLLAFVMTVLQVFHIQADPRAARYARSYTVQERNVEAVRGDILDRNGQLLVTSVPIYDLYFDFAAEGLTEKIFRSEVDALARALSDYFQDKTAREYRRLLTRGHALKHRYYPIKKGISYRDWQVVRRFPLFRLQRPGYIVGLIRVERYRRLNVHGIADRMLGYVRNDVKVGIEGAYDAFLRGTYGKQRMKKTYGGVWVPVDGSYVVEPLMGATVQTTLDYRIQKIAEKALLRGMILHQAAWGSVVIMETATGAVRALANLRRTDEGVYRDDRNYAIGEAIEPGSTMKLATLLVLMADAGLRPDDSIDVDHRRFRIYDRVIRDGAQVPTGRISLREAFIYSSNVAFGRWTYELYHEAPERFLGRLQALKLDRKLGIPIPGEAAPFIPTPKDRRWSGTTLPWLAFGYGLKLTPLQILTLYNGVVNGGKMVAPRFAEALIHPDGRREAFHSEVRLTHNMAPQPIIDTLRALMREVVRHGTARGIRRGRVPIGGKTGTVWLYEGGTYHRDRYRASFVGFFPAEAPKYTAIVVINDPRGGRYSGGSVAAPILREIAEEMYVRMIFDVPSRRSEPPVRPARWVDRRKMPRDAFEAWARQWHLYYPAPEAGAAWVFTRAMADDTVRLLPVRLLRDDVPNVKGLPLADALYLMEGLGITPEIRGAGMRVADQSLPPGSPRVPRQKIILWTE